MVFGCILQQIIFSKQKEYVYSDIVSFYFRLFVSFDVVRGQKKYNAVHCILYIPSISTEKKNPKLDRLTQYVFYAFVKSEDSKT